MDEFLHFPTGSIPQEEFVNRIIKDREKKFGLNTNLISDGSHTFGELYHERATWFAIFMYNYMDLTQIRDGKRAASLGKYYKELFIPLYGWKSKLHHDGSMYENYFIVGVTDKDTGRQFTYHYHISYWDFFDVDELERAPEWNPDLDMSIDEIACYFVPNYTSMKYLNQ